MALIKVLLFVLVSVLGYSSVNSAFVDTLNKCHLKDKQCLKATIQKALKDIPETGIPELGIPSIDPVHIKSLDASIPKVLQILFTDGVAKGVKNCVINDLNVDIEHLHGTLDLTCDITLKGKYNVRSKSDVFTQLLGGEVHGEGNGKIKLEQIHLVIEFPFEIVKRDDGIFFKSDLKKYKYTFNILKKVVFAASNLYLGEKEASEQILKLLNENWKLIIEAFGNHFIGIAMTYMHDFIQKFFAHVPVEYYLLDDFSKYV